ncbi:MAG: ergosterol biosynthesis protein [Acidimicrobiia bacterium]|nr:ergosterol biosynthesis protein [Acidimicrobiia bacterium]
MIEWLGIGHLFELSGSEAIAGFLTPLVVFAVFFLLQLILPARKAPGYVTDPATGEPRRYRLNGLLVYLVVLIVWAFELTGMERVWFYRSSVYAVAGGTVLAVIFTLVAVFSQPKGENENTWLALWEGRARELSFLGERFDVKMYLYVVGGAMFALNALSGAAYHYELFGDDSNPGVFLYAAFFSFYIMDYFVFERVQLYTYDLIHENLGFKLLWGGLIVYGWLYILPLWGMAVHPDPGFSGLWRYVWLIGTPVLFLGGWAIGRGANLQKYTFKRWPDRKFLGLIEPLYIEAGDRKILCSGFWGVARHFNYLGEGFLALSIALVFGYVGNLWAWTYFIFIVSFFTVRQIYDDRFCAEKYGPEKWAEYQDRVKYRIFPGVY